MLPTTRYLLLPCLQEVECRGVVGEFHPYGQRLYEHTDGACQSLVLTSFVGGTEQCLLFVVVFRQQEAIHSRKEGILEDAVLITECLNSIHTGT